MEDALKLARQLGVARAAQRSLKSLEPPGHTMVSSISEGVDYFTKWPVCQAISDQEAKTVAHCLEELICHHGVPHVFLADQERNF